MDLDAAQRRRQGCSPVGEAVPAEHAGKALAAVNLAFFAGAAVIQGLSAPVVALWGLGGVIAFLGFLSIFGAVAFHLAGRRAGRP